MVIPLQQLARFPVAGDNAAIALADIKHGTRTHHSGLEFDIQHDILTGHRFAAVAIPEGCTITSWRYPFGTAARDIAAGEYLCNENVLFRLSIQEDPHFTSHKLPDAPNFTDEIAPFHFDESKWQMPEPVELYPKPRTFMGYDRGKRGVGTRNHLVILNTSATNVLLKATPRLTVTPVISPSTAL